MIHPDEYDRLEPSLSGDSDRQESRLRSDLMTWQARAHTASNANERLRELLSEARDENLDLGNALNDIILIFDSMKEMHADEWWSNAWQVVDDARQILNRWKMTPGTPHKDPTP